MRVALHTVLIAPLVVMPGKSVYGFSLAFGFAAAFGVMALIAGGVSSRTGPPAGPHYASSRHLSFLLLAAFPSWGLRSLNGWWRCLTSR
jgi:hypothetical protein